jgi:hypothetical protein
MTIRHLSNRMAKLEAHRGVTEAKVRKVDSGIIAESEETAGADGLQRLKSRLLEGHVVGTACFSPQLVCDRGGIDIHVVPPSAFVPPVMESAVMDPAQRHGKLVTDFPAKRAWLGKAKVVRVGW